MRRLYCRLFSIVLSRAISGAVAWQVDRAVADGAEEHVAAWLPSSAVSVVPQIRALQ